ncbi:Cytochrome c oxidase copper chaperone Cox17 [Penicillium soppii]|uniref:Cytochrome c oxidase copper chaperone Cox17 n=1 Tax=Penicillium soppii TaxID=69789 RepID=UPI002549AFC5|nr:Cytochrome c oxidase copper chaperone Cox17 [Penicillium soppii]KAJ5864594.1 Cytochrome c oxidase copper chaperone Cox17 [Penicillium soppii]
MSWLFGSSSGESPYRIAITLNPYTCAMRQLHCIAEMEYSFFLPLDLTENKSAASEQAPAQTSQTEKPKPCCVCKPEKTARDDCMLFSKSENPEEECKTTIEQYKTCMAGFGFKV